MCISRLNSRASLHRSGPEQVLKSVRTSEVVRSRQGTHLMSSSISNRLSILIKCVKKTKRLNKLIIQNTFCIYTLHPDPAASLTPVIGNIWTNVVQKRMWRIIIPVNHQLLTPCYILQRRRDCNYENSPTTQFFSSSSSQPTWLLLFQAVKTHEN